VRRRPFRTPENLTVARAPKHAREARSAATKRFLRGERLLTFKTTRRKVASLARVFNEAAATFKAA